LFREGRKKREGVVEVVDFGVGVGVVFLALLFRRNLKVSD